MANDTNLFGRDFSILLGQSPTADGRPAPNSRLIQARPAGPTSPSLRVQFKIEKNLFSTPNTSDITIYNLSSETRALLQRKNAPCTVEAGYEGNTSEIFNGQVTFANHVKAGPDWITRFQAGDGVAAVQSARVNESFGPGSTPRDVMLHAIDALGLGRGNALDQLARSSLRGMDSFRRGVAVSGRATDVLTEHVGAAGLTWSVQAGQIQILPPNEASAHQAVLLDPAHGLVGSVEEGEDKQKRAVVRVRSLLQASLAPGRPVQLVSRNVTGAFKIESVVHSGDTWGQEWYSDLEMTAL